jgi:hypothetical protein
MSARLVREIAAAAFTDAIEILGLIEVLEAQNQKPIRENVNKANAGRAAAHIQRSLFTRLHFLVARAYGKTRKGDQHTRMAFELLRDEKVAKEMRQDDLKEAQGLWGKGQRQPQRAQYGGHTRAGGHRGPPRSRHKPLHRCNGRMSRASAPECARAAFPVFASALCGQFRGTHQFVQEPESLSLHLANKKIYPRRVAAGPAEAGDKTKLDRVVGAVAAAWSELAKGTGYVAEAAARMRGG